MRAGAGWARGLAWVVVAWLVFATGALAQSTGSSAGGGSWGSSSGGSSSSSSSSWSSSGGSSTEIAAANSYEPPFWAQLLVFVGFLVLLYLLFRGLGRLAAPVPITVARLSIAIDARARRFVQAGLAKTVGGSDTTTKAGLTKLLRAVADVLRASRAAWIYGAAEHLAPAVAQLARASHARLANDARARFSTELVRKSEGRTQTSDAPALVAREHEGEGVVVVTLIVATYAKIEHHGAELDGLARCLEGFAKIAEGDLVALELVWSPSAEDDRMSTVELEALYTELKRLTGVGGRVFCGHCAGPYPDELAKCPHCGAPRASASPSTGA